MNYKERYNAALERARKELQEYVHKDCDDMTRRESEDERIRREILEYINSYANLKDEKIPTEWLEWLEKQGEQETDGWHSEDEQNLNACLGYISDEFLRKWLKDAVHTKYDKPAYKVEPKFKVGDWITVGNYTWKIVEVKSLDYILQSQDGNIVDDNISYVDKQFHLWTIQDAKDGDVLVTSTGQPFIFSGKYDDIHYGNPIAYCGVNWENKFKIGNGTHWTNKNEVAPATKEQRVLLFAKMKEAGYEWDAEKKELKKMEVASKESEDEKIRKDIIAFLLSKNRYMTPNEDWDFHNKWLVWLEKQREKLDPDKVIGWLIANICDFEYYVNLFRKDFEL